MSKPREYNQVIRTYYHNYKNGHGSKRKIAFELQYEEFENLVIQDCYKTREVSSISGNGKFKYVHSINMNGIDRVNNDLGYSIENCVPCCKRCNTAKGNHMDFFEWIKKIYDRNEERI